MPNGRKKIRGFAERTAGFFPKKKVQPDFQAGFVAADLSIFGENIIQNQDFCQKLISMGISSGVKHETAMRYLERHGNIKNRSLSLSKCPCSKHIKKRIKKRRKEANVRAKALCLRLPRKRHSYSFIAANSVQCNLARF